MRRVQVLFPVVLVLAASCATPPQDRGTAAAPMSDESVVVIAAPRDPAPAPASSAERTWEAWPAAETLPAPAPQPTAGTVKITPREGGWQVIELIEHIHRATGRSVLYQSTNAALKNSKVEFIGDHTIHESELFDWLQAVLSFHKLVLVPVGPKGPDGAQQWLVMDQADPNLRSRPTWIEERDVFRHEDRDGFFVVTMLRVRDTVDPARVQRALAPLSTQTAGIGRIQEMGSYLIVSDFAPVVAAMKRMLDRINNGTPPSAVRPVPAAK